MGRGKLENRLMENRSSRRDSFNKRNKGILKKAYELAFISGCGVHIVLEAEDGNVYEFHRRMSPAMQSSLFSNKTMNRLMFFNGLQIMDTGTKLTMEERAALLDPAACGCFDCRKGYSSRLIDTINAKDQSENPFKGDFRLTEASHHNHNHNHLEMDVATAEQPLPPPLPLPLPLPLVMENAAPQFPSTTTTTNSSSSTHHHPLPPPHGFGYGHLPLPLQLNFHPSSPSPSTHCHTLHKVPSDQYPSTNTVTSAPTSDDEIKDSSLCNVSLLELPQMDNLVPLKIEPPRNVEPSQVREEPNDDIFKFFECAKNDNVTYAEGGVDTYKFDDFNDYHAFELVPFNDVNNNLSLDDIII